MLDTLRVCSTPAVSICVIGLLLAGVITPTAVAVGEPTQPQTDNTVTRIHVYSNGSAQWKIQIRTRLGTDDRADEYQAFQARFRENTSRYLDPFRERMRGVVAKAANATGREMRAANFTASTSIQEVPRRWGVVTYQFTWTHFAAQRNETLSVGDIFQGGFFLAANDTLEIESPAGYEIARTEPTPASRDEGGVTWVGREDFADRHPQVVYTPSTDRDATAGAHRTSRQPPTDNETTPSPFGDFGSGVVLAGTLLLGLLSIGVYATRRRGDRGRTDRTATANPTADSPETTQSSTSPEMESDEFATTAEIMTDTERVQNLLEATDGRMRQAAIADEFDWSASKVSRVIGKMVDEGTVEKLQLGRENLIELANAAE